MVSLKASFSSLRHDDVEWTRDELGEGLRQIGEDVHLLTEHIENLLSLAQLESGAARPQRDWVALEEVVELATRLVKEAEYRRIAVSTDDRFLVRVDQIQVAQVLRHLLENALAYSPGEVRLDVGVCDAGLRFCVEDGGSGVPPEERQQIFLKLYRGQAATSSVRGTGLGLSICREIVAAHAGSIAVDGSPSLGGARFTVTIPSAVAEAGLPLEGDVSGLALEKTPVAA
jgi:K+-sensing histidine kinase KdpD